MQFQNIENGFFVTINNSEENSKAGTINYTRVDNGETFFISQEWFNKWFKPVTTTPSKKKVIESVIIGIVLECEAGFIDSFEMEELAEDQIEAYTDDPSEYLELYSCLNAERLARGV